MGVGEDCGDYPAIVPLMPNGSDAAASHLTWHGDVMGTGEVAIFERSGCCRRYHTPLCRTVFLGPLPDRFKTAEAAMLEGLEPMEDNAARDLVAELTGAIGTDLVSFGTEAGLFQSHGVAAIQTV